MIRRHRRAAGAGGKDGYLVIVLLALLAVGCGDGAEPAARPNVVLILLDNLDERTSPYWEAMPKTRALLADQGLVFANAFVSDPI